MSSYTKIRRFGSDCHVFQFSPTEFRFDVSIGKRGTLERLSAIAGEPKADEYAVAKMNGGFFSMNGSTEYIGSFVDEGLYYQGASPMYPTAVFTKENKLIIEHSPNQSRHAWYQSNAWFAIGCPWTIIVNGKKDFTYTKTQLVQTFGHPYQRAPRSMFGQKADKTIVWVVADGRTKTNAGLTIEHEASIMLELGCVTALNVDGGGSSEMIYNGNIVNKPSDKSERRIGTAFLAYAKRSSSGSSMNRKGYVTAAALNVRNKPNTSGKIVDCLSKNVKVTIIGTDPNTGWYKIQNAKSSEAYVSNNYIKLI